MPELHRAGTVPAYPIKSNPAGFPAGLLKP